jgi:hypothetical protein
MSNQALTPIPTRYKGYHFRSRLEARWAVFFDALGLKWQYEVEGFTLPSGTRYLPDFCVQGPGAYRYWYEVKPQGVESDPKFDEFKRTVEALSNGVAVLLSGDPLYRVSECGAAPCFQVCPRCGLVDRIETHDAGDEIGFACRPCDVTTPCGGGHPYEPGSLRWAVPVTPHKGFVMTPRWSNDIHDVSLRRAANAARSARFEGTR